MDSPVSGETPVNERYPFLSHIPDEERSLSRKDEVLLISVLDWYNEDESNVRKFYDILKHKNGLSLRIIDWLITNFSKKVNVSIENHGIPGDLHRDYHKNLSAHNKKNFDPFARRERICILLGDEKRFSTIGQLNFFRWFLQKNIYSYLLENKPVIEKHMRDHEKMSKKRSQMKFLRGKGVSGKLLEEPCNETDSTTEVNIEKGLNTKPQSFSGSFTLRF